MTILRPSVRGSPKAGNGHLMRALVFSLCLSVVQACRGLFLIPFIIARFGSIEYGRYALTISLWSYGALIVQFGLDTVAYQFLPHKDDPREFGRTFWPLVAISMTLGVALSAAAIAVALVVDRGMVFHIGIICVVVLSQVAFVLLTVPLRCQGRIGVFFVLSIILFLGDFAVTLAASDYLGRLNAVFAVLAIYYATAAGLAFLVQVRRVRLGFDGRVIKPALRLGSASVVNQAVVSGYFVADRTIISIAAGVGAVACYAPAVALINSVIALNAAATAAYPTELAKLAAKGEWAEMFAVLREGLARYLMIGIPACLGLAVIAKPVLTIMTGPDLAKVGVSIAWVGAVAVLFNGILRFPLMGLVARGQHRWLAQSMVVNFITFVLVLLAVAMAVPGRAGLAAALCILGAMISQSVATFWKLGAFKHIVALEAFAKPTIACLGIGVLALYFHPVGLGQIAAFVGVSIASYALLICLLMGGFPWRARANAN